MAVVDATVALGALQFDVSYDGALGSWIGHGGDVECEVLGDGIMAANYAGASTVKIGLVSIAGIPTPGPVVRCGFRSPDEISTSSFVARVVDASDTSSAPVDPMPTMRVSSVAPR